MVVEVVFYSCCGILSCGCIFVDFSGDFGFGWSFRVVGSGLF